MDEMSWRAKLAKSNINILWINWNEYRTTADVYYEFMYHPKPGQTKWCKTVTSLASEDEYTITGSDIAEYLAKEVLALRKELEV